MQGLKDKVTIVTGAGSGLGKATAERFAAEGAILCISDIDPDRGQAVADALGADFIAADVTREEDVERLVTTVAERHGRLDCMINNAGVLGSIGSILDIETQDWRATMSILLDSVFFGIKHAGRVMRSQQSGVILSASSTAGIAPVGPHAYTTAKHAVVGLTRSAASEMARWGVRVNAVAPGTVPSAMTGQVFGGQDQTRAAARGKNPLPRTVEAAEVAGGYAYLASDDAINITGHVLVIDAGLIMLPPGTDYENQTARFIDARKDAPLTF